MPSWLVDLDPREGLLYIVLFASGVLAVQGAMGIFRLASDQQTINRRLQVQSQKGSVEDLILELRRERGLNADGEHSMVWLWFNRLVTRSGLRFQPLQWAGLSALVAGAVAGLFAWKSGLMLFSAILFLALFVLLPILALGMIGKKRAAKLAQQLPDALAIVVRSLEAGHPVPTAISLVGREMPDPIGSEFGMVGDELAYGSSLSDAVLRLAKRAEDPDLDLFSATVRLQERTGGNLAELLKLIGAAVRGRQTLRLKVKAASAEGRASAIILTSAPFVVASAIYFMRPQFYGEVIHLPMVQYGLGGFLVWMGIGNLIMQRMIRFKI